MSRATAVNLPISMKIQRSLLQRAANMPRPVRARLSRFTPVNAAGERLDPAIALVAAGSQYVPRLGLVNGSPARSRRMIDINAALLAQRFRPFAVEEDLIIDTADGPLPATRYSVNGTGKGLIVFYHGGGFVLGSRASHDSAVRALAIRSGADVLSVDYRLAPENPFPAAVNDAIAAFRFAVGKAESWGIDPRTIAVAGDSAGGNLSAVVSQQVRHDDVVPCLQLLIYPVVDMNSEHGSMAEFAKGYLLTEEHFDYFGHHYLGNDEAVLAQLALDPRVSPIVEKDLAGLPPAHVVVAGFDPLRDGGLQYADLLTAAGVPVTVDRVGPAIHGFLQMGLLSPHARKSIAGMGQAVAKAVAAV